METKYEMRLIPTDKSNRIVLSTGKYGGLFRMEHYGSLMTEMGDSYQLLLITSNEKIEVGDFGINLATNSIFRVIENTPSEYSVKFITGGNLSNTISKEEWSHAVPTKIIASSEESITRKSWINLSEHLWILQYYNDNKEFPGNDLWDVEMNVVTTGQCNCPCHGEDAMIMHIMACCNPEIHYEQKSNLDGSICLKRITPGIPKDFKEITGWDTPAEKSAYYLGREHEQNVIIKWIENWNGSTNSVMGQLLHDKLKELK